MNENEERIVFITQFQETKKNVRQNRKDLISANSSHLNEREQIIQRIIFLPPTAFKTFHHDTTGLHLNLASSVASLTQCSKQKTTQLVTASIQACVTAREQLERVNQARSTGFRCSRRQRK